MASNIMDQKNTPGLDAFYQHLLDISLAEANQQLNEENMMSLEFYSKNKDRYPDEYKHAFMMFKRCIFNHLFVIGNKIMSELYTKEDEN